MFTVVAVVVGMVVGLVTGGKLRHLGERPFRWVWLLVVGVALQILTEVVQLARAVDYTTVLVSYVLLALFALLNLRLRGMGVVAIGLALNIIPIAVNHGMPVRASAIVEARLARPDQVDTLRFGGKRHLERPSDRIMVLGDILPDWVFHEVLSFGDIVMAVGITAVFVNLLRPPARRRARGAAPVRPAQSPAEPPSRLPPALMGSAR